MRTAMMMLMLLAFVAAGCDVKNEPRTPSSPDKAGEVTSKKGTEEKAPLASDEEIMAAFEKGAGFLAGRQDAGGAWMMEVPGGKMVPNLGFTGLAIAALANSPSREKHEAAIQKGVAWMNGKRNEDGSFGVGSDGQFLKSYGTAIALMMYSAVDLEKYRDQVRGAQAYLKQNQIREGGPHEGGTGYGDLAPSKDGQGVDTKNYANLATTGFAADGLEASGLPKDDEFWKLVIKYCRRLQNNSEVNTDPEWLAQLKEAGLSIGDDGGLFYAAIPKADKASKAGTVKIADKEVIKSYGSMTYEGIKIYIYAGLAKDSPEVKAAMDWVRKNYTVDVHPGFRFDVDRREHLMGVYYYYVTMAKALDAYGEKPLKLFNGETRDWVRELGSKLASLQTEDGSWKNSNPRWYEDKPELATAYALMAGNVIMENLK